MRINNNLMAMNTHRQLGIATNSGAKSTEKLSSGYRINRAGDDAAGLSISEKMRGQIRGLNMASRNAQDGISLIQTAEGALNETHAILQRMRELTIQAANDTNVDVDREAIKTEMDQLVEELDRIAETTQFNKQNLLDGTFGVQLDTDESNSSILTVDGVKVSVAGLGAETTVELGVEDNVITATITDGVGENNVQEITVDVADTEAVTRTINFDKLGFSIKLENVDLSELDTTEIVTLEQENINLAIGANENQSLEITINDMQAEALGVEGLDVSTYEKAQISLTAIQNAIEEVSTERATLGAWQNRLEHTIKNLDNSAENLQAAESRIRDVDMAQEMMEFTKQNILQQASTAMLAQANVAPQSVLQLLQ